MTSAVFHPALEKEAMAMDDVDVDVHGAYRWTLSFEGKDGEQ